MSSKYPRTYHLPWSPGATRDDKIQHNIEHLLNKNIIITEKMDGSNVMLSSENVFSRSHSGPPTHPSFDGLKQLHAQINYKINKKYEIFGEWCYAKHSIEYSELPSYFLCFAVRESNYWLGWESVVEITNDLDLWTVPVLYSGTIGSEKELKTLVDALCAEPSACGGEREGLVVRVMDNFSDTDFNTHQIKIVRKNHVQTDSHWKNQKIVKNKLKV